MKLHQNTKQQRLNRSLVKKYPFLRFSGTYDCTWLDCLPPGWKKNFGLEMCQNLKKILKKAHYVNKFKFYDIKEKWGYLNMNYSSIPSKIADEIDRWERYYEDLSVLVCIDCGAPTSYITNGWINYKCKDCAPSTAVPLTYDDAPKRVTYKDGKEEKIISELDELFRLFWDTIKQEKEK